MSQSNSIVKPFVTTAPGKVIIFGEHSAVYGEPAIAAAVSKLRTYLLVVPVDEVSIENQLVELSFPDINFDHQWTAEDLKECRDYVDSYLARLKSDCTVKIEDKDLDQGLVDKIHETLKRTLPDSSNHIHHAAALCFLYLYLIICPLATNVKFILKSNLPIGAGLGSSASIAVCLSLAFVNLSSKYSQYSFDVLSEEMKTLINKFSLIGEKCIHGTPSGIDNAVATYGNAVMFQKITDPVTSESKNKMEIIGDFPEIPMILTNTKIPKSTKILVSNVRELSIKYPNVLNPIFQSMGQLTLQGHSLLKQIHEVVTARVVLDNVEEQGDEKRMEKELLGTKKLELYDELHGLIKMNHGLLSALNVSHPGLEEIKKLSDTLKVGSTKLTGAGGGGCALTILNLNQTENDLHEFETALINQHKYDIYKTGLGGKGAHMITSLDTSIIDSFVQPGKIDEDTLHYLNSRIV